MKIYTFLDEASRSIFERIKRKKKVGWKFLVAGEWSQSPMHQGKTSFYYSHTSDRKFWALLERNFPIRIVAVAEVGPDAVSESVLGEMFRAVREDGGSYIDIVDFATEKEIDFEIVQDVSWGTNKNLD